MGIFRCHGNVCYIVLIDAIFCKVHSIDPSNVCITFERNRLRIDDFRKSEKIVCFLWRYESGDIDLDLNPILTKKLCHGTQSRVHLLSKFQKDWTSPVACRAFKDGQTYKQSDRQTDRGDQYTLQKSTILQSNKKKINIKFGKPQWPCELRKWEKHTSCNFLSRPPPPPHRHRKGDLIVPEDEYHLHLSIASL